MLDAALIANAISLLAVIISLAALVRARQADEAAKELQRKQEKLAEHEIERHERERAARMKAEIRFQVVNFGKGSRKLVLRNEGEASASNLVFSATPMDGRDSPFLADELRRRFPAPELSPGSECSLLMSLTMGCSAQLRAEWAWENADGTPERRTTTLFLP